MPPDTDKDTKPDEIDRLQTENKSLRDRLLRALAESENTRRQAQDRLEDARQFSIADFARELLIVIDNLERAITVAENENTISNRAMLEGVKATERLFVQTLERFGVRRIEALGHRFDPHLHEAVMAIGDGSQPASTIVRVVDEGYTIHDRLLRPSRVVVTKSQKETPRTPEDDELGSEWGSQWIW